MAILFDPDLYAKLEADTVARISENTNKKCSVAQCLRIAASTNSRCRLCVKDSTSCRHHRHQNIPGLSLSERKKNYVFGYDRGILSNPAKWLADDAMITGLGLLQHLAKKKNYQIDMITGTGVKTIVQPKTIRGIIVVILRNNHWFVCWYTRTGWWLADSLPKPATEQIARLRQLERELQARYETSKGFIGRLDTLEQLNANDCGFFSLYNVMAILTNREWVSDARNVRHFIVCFLVSKGAFVKEI